MSNFELISLAGIILAILGYYGYQNLVLPNREKIEKVAKRKKRDAKLWWMSLEYETRKAIKSFAKILAIVFIAWICFFANIRGVETTSVQVVKAITTNRCGLCGGDHGTSRITLTFNDGGETASSRRNWLNVKTGDVVQKIEKKKLFRTKVTYNP